MTRRRRYSDNAALGSRRRLRSAPFFLSLRANDQPPLPPALDRRALAGWLVERRTHAFTECCLWPRAGQASTQENRGPYQAEKHRRQLTSFRKAVHMSHDELAAIVAGAKLTLKNQMISSPSPALQPRIEQTRFIRGGDCPHSKRDSEKTRVRLLAFVGDLHYR